MTEKNRRIRFIDSRYHEQFRLPDGGTIEVTRPDGQFSQKCSYVDDYHLEVGDSLYHICQFAEMLERIGASCRPEPEIQADQAAWEIGNGGFLTLQTCEDGYDYTLYDKNFHELDGGQLDNPELTMKEARNEILSDFGWDRKTMYARDFDIIQEKAAIMAEKELGSVRSSALEQLSGLKGFSSGTDTHSRRKEAER